MAFKGLCHLKSSKKPLKNYTFHPLDKNSAYLEWGLVGFSDIDGSPITHFSLDTTNALQSFMTMF